MDHSPLDSNALPQPPVHGVSAEENTPPKGIIAWFASNSVAANLLMLLVLILGAMQLGELRKESFPSLEPSRVTISMVYESGSAQQAQEGLALKIEEALESVSGIDSITSTSHSNGTSVVVEMQSSADLDTLYADINTQIDAISNFPSGAENPVVTKQSRQDHALQIAIHGDTDRRTLQQLQTSLKQALLRQSGINEVISSGDREPQIRIELDEGKLQAYSLNLADISARINAESLNTVTSQLRGSERSLSVVASDQGDGLSDFANIVINSETDGSQLLLGDVAKISDGFDTASSVEMRFQGEASVALQLVMNEHSDITQVVTQAKAVIADWQGSGRLPEGVNVTAWYDKSDFISERLELLSSNALQGMVMVGVLLALFLNLRVAFWVVAGLPFCFIGTFFFMGDSFWGLSLNEMTTFGFIMALGIVVDDAVVVGESIYTTKQREGDSLASTIKGTQRVAIPTLFGVLTTVAAFAPITQVDGHMGQLFAQFACVVVVCLLLSVVESKLILPAHLAHVRTRNAQAKSALGRIWQTLQQTADNGLHNFSLRIYQPLLRIAIHFRYAMLLGFITLLILSAGLITSGQVRSVFFPEISGEVVSARFSTEDDAGYGLAQRHLASLEKSLLAVDQQLQIERHLEGSVMGYIEASIEDDNSGSITVELNKDSGVTITDVERLWRQATPNLEAVTELSFNSGWNGPEDLSIELLGNDQDLLDQAAKQLRSVLASKAGVSDITDTSGTGQPQLRLTLNAAGRALGFTSQELSQQLLQALGGAKTQTYQRGYDEVEVFLSYPEAQRQSLASLQQLRVRSASGERVPLANVAEVHMEYEKNTLTRLDQQAVVMVTASLDKNQLSPTDLVQDLQVGAAKDIERNFYGVSVEFGGESEQQAETSASMLKMFGVALMLIFLLLAVPLKSYVQPMLIMMAIPFGIVGAIWGHWFSNLAIGVLSLNGIMALSGVVVNDSLLLVSHFNEAKARGLAASEAIFESATSRLRAIFLTSITTFAGLLPILSETSQQSEFLKPAAASMAYGILFATLITLVLIPVLLKISDDVERLFRPEESSAQAGKTAGLAEALADTEALPIAC